uniref:Metallophos domain-containing protein n=1 Tax=Parastrongyloides trichosuri TaxID=131310 RepID=A0A0N4ZGJ0_PARTI
MTPQPIEKDDDKVKEQKQPQRMKQKETKIGIKDGICNMKSYELFSPDYKNLISSNKDNHKSYEDEDCEINYKNNFYTLQDGILSSKGRHIKCQYSCKYPDGDREIIDSDFISFDNSVLLPCDVFQLMCNDLVKNVSYYDFTYHIRRLNNINEYEPSFLKKKYKMSGFINKRYDVHIYVIGSLSRYQALRSLKETRKYLLENYFGVEFNYLNVHQGNGRSNGYSLLLNRVDKNIYDIFGLKKPRINDWGRNDACKVPLREDTYLVTLFRKMGYITLIGEDAEVYGYFNWPNCVGFIKNVAHHFLRPFQILFGYKDIQTFVVEKFVEKCQFYGFHILEYLEKFLDRYYHKPKMTLLWQTNIMDEDIENSYKADKYFAEFFENVYEYYNNSFVFFIGNHGYQRKNYLDTGIGSFENKNPYFFLSVPYELKKNKELIKNLKENSNKHISFLDIYATILDILTDGRKNNFNKLTSFDLSNTVNFKVKGSSLFRPVKKGRTCYDMYISYENCLCETHFEELDESYRKERKELKKAFVMAINSRINSGNASLICEELSLDKKEIFKVRKAISDKNDVAYEVEGVVQPGNLKYKATFDKKFALVNNVIELLAYEDKKKFDCAKVFYATSKSLRYKEVTTKYNKSLKCTIPTFDIWSSDIKQFVKRRQKTKECIKRYTNEYYEIKNDYLSLHPKIKENIKCHYIKLLPKGDNDWVIGKKKPLNQPIKMDFDIFKVVCIDENKKVVFKDINYHVRRLEITNRTEKVSFLRDGYGIENRNKKYSINIFVIDSLSYYHAKRGLTKTRKLLLKNYQSIEFPLLNRISDNSRPNAYGFLMNMNRNNISSLDGDKKPIFSDFGEDDPCRVQLKDDTYIAKMYRDMGYITMNGEDYISGSVFRWNRCKSFINEQYDHTLRPFQLARRIKSFNLIIKKSLELKCLKYNFFLQDYMKQFAETYKDKASFSWIWATDVLHHHLNNIYEYDDMLEDYFKENEKTFENNFLIIMSDHGFRLSDFQRSDIGKYEANNPYFMISVPKDLRDNDSLMRNLKYNSKKLISHMDVYATLLDILTEARRSNFNDMKPFDLSTIVNFKVKGKSLLRLLPRKNRSCFELYIPLEFCLCSINFDPSVEITNFEENVLKINFINNINTRIANANLTEECAVRTINEKKPFKIVAAYKNDNSKIYKVEGYSLPGIGLFLGIFDSNFKLISNEIQRINKYGEESDKCIEEQLNSKYCYCKKLIQDSTK